MLSEAKATKTGIIRSGSLSSSNQGGSAGLAELKDQDPPTRQEARARHL